MREKDLKVGSLYQTYASRSSFIVKHGYLRVITGRRWGKRFLIYLGKANPAEVPFGSGVGGVRYFWVFVGNEKCLMRQDRLRAIKPMEET